MALSGRPDGLSEHTDALSGPPDTTRSPDQVSRREAA